MNPGPWCISSAVSFTVSPALLSVGPMSPGEPPLQHPTSRPPNPAQYSIPICTWWTWSPLFLGESYKWCHHSWGMAQSLDSSVGPLLKVVMVPGHVEGGERRATPLHGAGNGWRGQRHPKSAVWRQRTLDGVRNGGRYGRCAGTKGSQRLWVLKAGKTGWRWYPGAERQIIGCCKCWSWKEKQLIRLETTSMCKSKIILSGMIDLLQEIGNKSEIQKDKHANHEGSLPFQMRSSHLHHRWKREFTK